MNTLFIIYAAVSLLGADVHGRLGSVLGTNYVLRLLLFPLVMALIITPIIPSGGIEGSFRVRFLKLLALFLLLELLLIFLLLLL